MYGDLAIIITADHGENFGELGVYSEHGTADEPTCHIPLIIKWPGVRPGSTDAGFHYLLDLAPTVADLLRLPHSPRWDGQSFAPALMTGVDCGREALVLSQMAHVCQRSVRFGDWLYIRTVHDGFRLFDREMLFNLARDPHEQCDQKALFPEICGEGARKLLAWQETMMESSPSPIDPMWTVMQEGGPYHTVGELPGYVRRLEATGRADKAAQLRGRYRCQSAE